MDIYHILGYLGAVLTGLVLGLMGGGRALLSVPVLYYLFNYDAPTATAYSLFLVGVAASTGAVQNIRKGLVHYKTALWYGIPSLITVFLVRSLVIPAIPKVIFSIGGFTLDKDHLILFVLAIVILLASYKMIKGGAAPEQPEPVHATHYPRLIPYAIGVGAFLGLVGAGGGFLMIPALVHFANLDMRRAVGTSLVLVAVNSFVGFAGDLSHSPNLNWLFLAAFSACSVAGVFVGHYLAGLIDGQRMKVYFGWLMLAIGVFIVVKELLR